ncbi:hypothetical protein EJB05_03850, partial [Eragrostis curvula]
MGHRRRFLNFVVRNCKSGVYSLRRLDLSRQRLFYPTTPPNADLKSLVLEEMESIRLPAPSIRFQPNPAPPACIDLTRKVHCFGLSESKIICTDNAGLSFLYDAGLRAFVTMPSLHAPKRVPISFALPDDDPDQANGGDSSLYLMEQVPYPHYEQKGLFEAFVYTTSNTLSSRHRKSWHRHSLPPPPFVLDPGFDGAQIDSHAVLGGGSHLCVSGRDIGTYCFDTASREWSRAGDWTLPFFDKAEHVPELGLWFGLSEKDLHPCVSDLSSVLGGRKPTLRNVWRSEYPREWNPMGIVKLAGLGSGRFCILEYFETFLEHADLYGEPVADQIFGVCTGVEVVLAADRGDGVSGRGKQAVRMVNHMSKLIQLPPGFTTIDAML